MPDLYPYQFIVIALSIIVILLAAWRMRGRSQHNFTVSPEARRIYAAATESFGGAERTTFGKLKEALPEADAVLYADLHAGYRSRALSPEYVQRILDAA